MSDINPNRMIPLHIADQAVAACEKEIAALKAEVERLRKAVKIAGGAVDCVIQVHDYGFNISTSYVESLKRDWLAAKEGNQP